MEVGGREGRRQVGRGAGSGGTGKTERVGRRTILRYLSVRSIT